MLVIPHSFFFTSTHKMDASDSSPTLVPKHKIIWHHIPTGHYLNYYQILSANLCQCHPSGFFFVSSYVGFQQIRKTWPIWMEQHFIHLCYATHFKQAMTCVLWDSLMYPSNVNKFHVESESFKDSRHLRNNLQLHFNWKLTAMSLGTYSNDFYHFCLLNLEPHSYVPP